MKNSTVISKGLLFLFLCLSSFTFVSCEKDIEGCTDPLSDNYNAEANVDDGNCIAARDKFLGSFAMTTICEGDSYEYTAGITPSPTVDDEVILTNLVDAGQIITGKILGDKITLVEAIYYGESLNGNGIIIDNTITFTLMITDGEDTGNCLATAVKQ